MGAERVITIHDLEHGPAKGAFRLNLAELAFDSPGVTALIGRNGAGKSTLLRLCAGLDRPAKGLVRFGEWGTWRHYEQIRSDVLILSWTIQPYEGATGAELTAVVRDAGPRWDAGRAAELQAELKIPFGQRLSSLSRGEQARLQVYWAVCRRPRVILIDEMTNELDSESRRFIFQALDAYTYAEGAQVVVATNILSDMERYATGLVALDAGRLALREPLERLKERCRKLRLTAGPGYSGRQPRELNHRQVSWDGHTGQMVTDTYEPDMLRSLAAMGIEAEPVAYPLEEIMKEMGVKK